MAIDIHKTAIVSKGSYIGDGSIIGPYCVVGPQVVLGNDCRLNSHVVLDGIVEVGNNCVFFSFSSIGGQPQDLKYGGEEAKIEIGNQVTVREYVTINSGTVGGGLVTKVGNDCLLMASSHVAHDCILEDNVILSNNATLAGHCVLGKGSILGGLSAVHQHVRIGEGSFLGGMSGLERDLIPYGLAIGNRARLIGINLIGLRRNGHSRMTIEALNNAFQIIFNGKGRISENTNMVEKNNGNIPEVDKLVDFIRSPSKRLLCRTA